VARSPMVKQFRELVRENNGKRIRKPEFGFLYHCSLDFLAVDKK